MELSYGAVDVSLEPSDILFNQSERVICFGSSNSGKTYLIEQLVKKHADRFYKIVLCGNRNRLLDYAETRRKTTVFTGSGGGYGGSSADQIWDPFSEITEYSIKKYPGRQCLIILDDLMEIIFSSSIVSQIFSRGRHLRISVIAILQSYCPAGNGKSLMTQIKNNCSYQIFTKFRSSDELGLIGRRLEGYDKKSREFFLSLFKNVVLDKRYGYLAYAFDITDCGLRYMTNLYDEDGTPYITVYKRGT